MNELVQVNLNRSKAHGWDPNTDQCKCGAMITYHEDEGTHGCERSVWRRDGRPVDGDGHVVGMRYWLDHVPCIVTDDADPNGPTIHDCPCIDCKDAVAKYNGIIR